MIKAIVFDLWETMGSKGFSISKRLGDELQIKDYEGYLQDYEKSIQLKEWKNREQMAQGFLQYFELEESPQNILTTVSTFVEGERGAKLFDGIKDLLVGLKKDYKLGLLSNTTVFEIALLDKERIRQLFDSVVCSHTVGALKPSKKMFDKALDELGVMPDECIYIDDSQNNIDSAKKLGFRVIRFENINQLKKDLANFGAIMPLH